MSDWDFDLKKVVDGLRTGDFLAIPPGEGLGHKFDPGLYEPFAVMTPAQVEKYIDSEARYSDFVKKK